MAIPLYSAKTPTSSHTKCWQAQWILRFCGVSRPVEHALQTSIPSKSLELLLGVYKGRRMIAENADQAPAVILKSGHKRKQGSDMLLRHSNANLGHKRTKNFQPTLPPWQ